MDRAPLPTHRAPGPAPDEGRLRDWRAGLDLIDSSSDGIIALDGEGRVRIWNRGAERLFGRTREEALGQRPEELFDEAPLFLPGSEGRLSEQRIRVQGQERIVNVSLSRLPAVPGEGPGTGAIVRDVTDTVRLRRVLEHSERLSQLGKMAAGIAHEVGNPLAGISSLVQTLLARLEQDEAACERLRLVKAQVARINAIIRQLVDYSRPTTAGRRPCDVNERIREAARLARYDERSHGVDLTLELDDRLEPVEAVPHQVQQVFVNLIHNALDATEGRSYRAVRVLSRRLPGGAEFIVEDNGCGIAPADLERVFDPFFTTKEPGRGTGLGLWICQGIVQRMPGELHIDSRIDKGTRVCLRVEMPHAPLDPDR
jgi:PAS domain S-box-containing protein